MRTEWITPSASSESARAILRRFVGKSLESRWIFIGYLPDFFGILTKRRHWLMLADFLRTMVQLNHLDFSDICWIAAKFNQ